MKEISDLLKSNDMKAHSYRKMGNAIFVDTNLGKVVVKKNNVNDSIFEYLKTRNFNYYPDMLRTENYIISKYEDDALIPDEQKIVDMVDLVSLLHSKTTHYKEVTSDEYKKIYEDLLNNYEYLYEYYSDLIAIIDDKIFMSPSEYLLARNISFIFKSIEQGRKYIDEWFKEVENLNKMRVVVVHNNLNLDHYIRNDKDYLISWDKSKIDLPIFDLYNLYNNHYMDFEFYELLREYQSVYPLKDYELELLFILITMPDKIEFNDNEYNKCIEVSNLIDKLYKSNSIIEEYKKAKEKYK